MGKTKTAFVSEMPEKPTAGKEGPHFVLQSRTTRGKEKPQKVHIAGLKGGQRIKTIDAGPIIKEEPHSAEPGRPAGGATSGKEKKRVKKIRVRGKKWQSAKAKVNPEKLYSPKDAIQLVQDTSYSKFDGTVELHLVLKKVGTQATVTLPNPTGKEKKIEIASEDTVKKLTAGKIDFDVLIATPEMMPKLVPFAKVLGPKGLMPNPKNGTLITDIKKAKDFSVNTINLKTEKEAPLIHTIIGKTSQKIQDLSQNLEAIIKALGGSKQIVKAYTKASMGPAVKIKISAESI